MMERAEQSKLITPEALQAAVNMMNPFPDDTLTPASWPDSLSSPTLTNVARQTIALSAPAGTTSSWNFHAAFIPVTSAVTSSTDVTYNRADGTLSGGSVNVVALKMFCVWLWKDSDPVPNIQTTAPNYTWEPTDVMPFGSITRLCAAGLEAINVSTELNRGGTAYAYRLPSNLSDVTYTPKSALLPVNGTLVRDTILQSPPANIEDFLNYGNTYMSDARCGVVCVATPEDHLNRFAPMVAARPILFNPRSEKVAFVAVPTSAPVFDWCTSGVWVTGLVPDAAFTLNLRAFFEYKPSIGDAFSMSLAKPCTPYSALFDDLVAGTIRTMPAGFDYSENPFGEWMGKILTTIASAMPVISSFIPHPVASSIVGALAPSVHRLGRKLQGKAKHKRTKVLPPGGNLPPPLPPANHDNRNAPVPFHLPPPPPSPHGNTHRHNAVSRATLSAYASSSLQNKNPQNQRSLVRSAQKPKTTPRR